MLDAEYARALAAFSDEVSLLRDWLHGNALPLWFEVGYDRQAGGFFERVALDGTPCVADNRRARVHPRQIYCFAAAGGRNVLVDWRELIQHGFSWFERVYRRDDALFGSVASPSGEMIDESFDLYNQAFALFAFSQLALSVPEQKDAMEQKARVLLSTLKAEYAHPEAGFEEGRPVKLPLCSNPHMHLFEACLAWETMAADPTPWTALADEIANLAITRFIDQGTGVLREFFDRDWTPFPGDKGRIVEPGHQFEWAWLLTRWGIARNAPEAIAAAERLFEIGVEHGVCEERQVAFMGLFDDFSISDHVARLWPQTEWLKASALLAQISHGELRTYYLRQAAKAGAALRKFLATDIPGLWYDKLPPSGQFVNEPAPASSFYHILCSIYEVDETLKQLQ
ncbi:MULTISPECIES: AGE family epimerase/isomerase [unclassified Rhizobium]|uniref:AGE family epimerase/isomerase n=1 Tax=unclassified Rhizobium TaxID=2613769 RepID=UPI00104E7E76|nr:MULTISPECIES: AGE family epimerase/isomerase [unclassified Rhizobium]MBB3395010.1 mannose-6-phosphate isomerase [Rhizobium sp. BK060]TCM78609.1 mannose-6-phosphate isomerase type 3 [Rhizobium sp. BK068]